jgi:Zn-dependent protease/CBS domain-containing protein
MNESIPLGRIAGIRIGLNWTLVVVFALVTLSLAGGELPAQWPGYSTVQYWIAGVVTALAFFASLLAHEMAHATIARRLNVRVDGITLWLFGGVARIRGEDMTARSELRIALAGPALSLLLGALLTAGGAFVARTTSWDLAAGAVQWLGRLNLILAVFNLMPAFPMDGGRVLRAVLWRRKGRARATRIAAAAGRGFAFLLIGLGVLDSVVNSPLGGLWLAFLGWFLLGAARSEELQARVEPALKQMRARDVMTADPITVPAWMTIEAFLQLAQGLQHKAYPLLDVSGAPAGLLLIGRAQRLTPAQRRSRRAADVACAMSAVPVAGPDDLLSDVLSGAPTCTEGRVLVVEDGRVVGIVTPTDMARASQAGEPAQHTPSS